MEFKNISYEEYLKYATDDEIKRINRIESNLFLSLENINQIKKIKKPISIIVFSEPYCPDCTIGTTIINKIAKENPNISIRYYSREGNEELLMKYTKKTKIPSIISNQKCYIEFPQKIEPINQIKIDQYRQGNYNAEVIKELIDILSNY